jgi:glycosyltransferase involved in cell wall biosynthesis
MDGIHLAVESVGTKHGGGAVVLRSLLEVVGHDSRFTTVTVYCSPREAREFDLPPLDNLVERGRDREDRSYLARVVWYQWGVATACRGQGVDVLLSANGMGIPGRGIAHVVLVQQALPYCDEALALLPLSMRVRLGVIRLLTCRTLRAADRAIVQSSWMAETLRARCRLSGAGLSVVAPSAVHLSTPEGGEVPASMLQCPADRRLLYVGSDAPHKNLETIVRVMPRLSALLPEATLFITLPEGDRYRGVAGVKGIGQIRGADLAATYAASTIVVQPSLIESGPLVPHEAIKCGRALLAADRPWAHEACRMGALYFNPRSGDDFLAKALLLLGSHRLRDSLVSEERARRRVGREAGYDGLADLLVRAHRRRVHTQEAVDA